MLGIENNNQVETEETFKVKVANVNQPKSARFIWGTLVANLRRLNLMTLHTACGELRDIDLTANVLTVRVKEEYLYNILIRETTYHQLLGLIKQIDSELDLKFVLLKKQEDKMKINLQKVKDMFGDSLIIK
ncbi:MAG: hypothetical protein IKI95_02250 [Clostridia bacterium]|nr:hypothetical protein [Clostridia bacterium]